MTLPVEETLSHLENSQQTLLNSRLIELSNLSSAELESFKRSWTTIEVKRRRQIVNRLVEMAEDNLQLNFDTVFKYCLKDDDDEVKSQAIEGLWENEEPSLINQLINLLGTGNSEIVWAAAAVALGKFAMLAEDKKLRPSYTLSLQDALLTAINDRNRPLEVRRRALEAAAPLSHPEVKNIINEAYRGPDSQLIISSIYAMGRNCDPSWLPTLQKELTSADAERRYEAASACGELEDEKAVPDLIRLINDSDVDVQMAALRALGRIGSTLAKESLEDCLDNDNQAVREAATQALNEIAAINDPLSFRL